LRPNAESPKTIGPNPAPGVCLVFREQLPIDNCPLTILKNCHCFAGAIFLITGINWRV
jgi:hypothetical protein